MIEMIEETYKLIEYDDFWRIPLAGRTVSRFLIDNVLSIEFIDPERPYIMVTLEHEFHLEVNRLSYVLTPKVPSDLGPIFLLRHNTVKDALAFKDGTLKVEFLNGDKFAISAHPDYEAWGIAGDQGLRLICLPGGELAVWKPEPNESEQE
jgi:uncharacterized protein DUF6188